MSRKFTRFVGAGLSAVFFDFDGVFTDNTVIVDDHGSESVRCWRGDGIGLAMLRRVSVPVWVISTETNPVVAHRAAKLGVDFSQGLTDKASELRRLAESERLNLNRAIFVGNDSNDHDAMRSVGFAVAVADASNATRRLADFVTGTRGGFGAVREVCNLIASVLEGPEPHLAPREVS